jgi:hypothetical protein
MALTKIKTLRASETYNVNSINANTVTVAGTSVTGGGGSSSFPGILTIKVTSNNYSFLDDTSVNTSGGFIQVGGVNFNANCTLLIGANNVISSAFVNTTTIQAQVPAAAAGTYHVYLIDSATGYTALKPNGLTHSAFPVWGTANSLFVTPTTATTNTTFNTILSANSDSNITYSNTSVLPPGSVLLANGYFYGNVSVNETTTYNFNVEATDVELQNTPKTFSIQIIKPSATFYSYEFSGSNSLWLQASDPYQTSITGNMYWGTNWTWECWIRPTVVPAAFYQRKCIYQFRYNGQRSSMHTIWLYDDGMIQVDTGDNGPYFADYDGKGSYTIPVNTWTHLALVKKWPYSGSDMRETLYVNGLSKRRTPNIDNYLMDMQPYSNVDIGAYWGYTNSRDQSQSFGFIGQISNMRITRNLAVYTGDFTVPTSPLGLTQSAGTNIAAITGDNDTGRVIFLTCNDSTIRDNGYYDRTASFVLKNGGPAIVAQSPFS